MSNLTQEEVLHLAIEATQKGEHGAAISYLKEGVERFPDDAKLAYVLGAEFAQIGIYDKAEIEMQRAIELDAELYTASFQLGLLQMTLGRVDDAKASWNMLEKLDEKHALRLFKFGLVCLAEENTDEARVLLEEGILLNDFSPELNTDMNMVLESIGNDTSESTDATNTEVISQARLNAYTPSNDD